MTRGKPRTISPQSWTAGSCYSLSLLKDYLICGANTLLFCSSCLNKHTLIAAGWWLTMEKLWGAAANQTSFKLARSGRREGCVLAGRDLCTRLHSCSTHGLVCDSRKASKQVGGRHAFPLKPLHYCTSCITLQCESYS